MKRQTLHITAYIMIFILIVSPLYSAEIRASEIAKIMDEGESVINDFYDSESENYFGKKVDAFFADDKNIQKVKDRAEEFAKKNATDTKYITPIYFSEELNDYVFKDILVKLKNIHNSYSTKIENKYNPNSEVSNSEIIVTTTGTFAGIIGIGAIALGIKGALTAKLILAISELFET